MEELIHIYVENSPLNIVDPSGLTPAAIAIDVCLSNPSCATVIFAAGTSIINAIRTLSSRPLKKWPLT